MDPNETLRQIRERIQRWRTADDRADENDLADTVVLLVEDLDEWLSKGGFPPDAWVEPMKRAAMVVQTMAPDLLPPPPNLARRRAHRRPLVVPPPVAGHYTDPLGPPDPAGVALPDDDYTPQAVNRTTEEED